MANTMDEFRRMFRAEFLPYDYQSQMRRELERRTQAPDEPLVEYVRATQEVYECADPTAQNAERVERAHQAKPLYLCYLPAELSVQMPERASRGSAPGASGNRGSPCIPTPRLLHPCGWSRVAPGVDTRVHG
ncbi:hypothetical protein HPB50_011283 [Hyalomma asiaticum]|uniref:Uncharacterized protein n=1 Tax=Hyalomma asiaticum TaxID=266040 RepID=A0ACB7TG86_HYAAI|nr:hypothetical protein HPB50_011283 [Hyalomma asiaticum]